MKNENKKRTSYFLSEVCKARIKFISLALNLTKDETLEELANSYWQANEKELQAKISFIPGISEPVMDLELDILLNQIESINPTAFNSTQFWAKELSKFKNTRLPKDQMERYQKTMQAISNASKKALEDRKKIKHEIEAKQ